MQQEDLLREIRDELKEIKRQLRALNDSIEAKNAIEKKKSTKPKYHVNQEHTEARRIAWEWHEQRTFDRERREKEKQRSAELSSGEDPNRDGSTETDGERQEREYSEWRIQLDEDCANTTNYADKLYYDEKSSQDEHSAGQYPYQVDQEQGSRHK
eukprot:7669631-Ditylum_brightwellii.AAC.1